jgi:hypothetical protein
MRKAHKRAILCMTRGGGAGNKDSENCIRLHLARESD